ncbi:hypothetical protein JKY72_04155 [Candidatus Gracilibacteria bacterium]|nr:hypothetical protein [Candidatus Gracilibacteria bacterium]
MRNLDTPNSDIDKKAPAPSLTDASTDSAETLMGPPEEVVAKTFDVTILDGTAGKEIQIKIDEKYKMNFAEAARLGFEFNMSKGADGKEYIELFRRGKQIGGKYEKAELGDGLEKALSEMGEQHDDAYTREAERLLNMKPQTALTRMMALMFKGASEYAPMLENFSSIGFSSALDRFPYKKDGELSDADKEIFMKAERTRVKDLREVVKTRKYPPTYSQQRKSVSYVRETLWGKNDVQDYHSLAGKLKRSLIPGTATNLLNEELSFSDFMDQEKPFGTVVFFLLGDKMLTGFMNEDGKLEYYDGEKVQQITIDENAESGSNAALNASTFRAAYIPLHAEEIAEIRSESTGVPTKKPKESDSAKIAYEEAKEQSDKYENDLSNSLIKPELMEIAKKVFPAALEHKERMSFIHELKKVVGSGPDTKESIAKAIEVIEKFSIKYVEQIKEIENSPQQTISPIDEVKLKVYKKMNAEMFKLREENRLKWDSLNK